MHGKAVALFDFTREHENELPLVEGQVIWVSYRHGQGWLVAEDPKTGESGLVPEEFVRLVRDIEGGLNSLNGEIMSPDGSLLSPLSFGPDSASTPTQAEHTRLNSSGPSTSTTNGGNSFGERHPSVVATFSTSSRDLDPYPQHLLDQTKTAQSHQDGKRGNGITILGEPPRKKRDAQGSTGDVNTPDERHEIAR
jgi:hypothetical protein